MDAVDRTGLAGAATHAVGIRGLRGSQCCHSDCRNILRATIGVEAEFFLFRENFELIDRRRVAMQRTLDHSAIEDVMHSSYRGLRKRESELMVTIGRMDVTFSRDLLLFRPS